MGDDKETTTSTSGPTNPAVNNTLTNLLGSLGGVAAKGVPTFDKSLYPGAGDTTRASWASMLQAGNDPTYSDGIRGATADFARAASGGDYSANDAYYKDLSDQTMTDVSGLFTGNGRFGSGSHVGRATQELGKINNANIAADRQWQAQAAGMLPSLYQAGLAPAGVQASVGAAQDADALARRQAEFDLHERQYGADWTNLGKAASIFGQLAGTGGQTMTTSSPATPWWMNAASLAGQFI
jgi:hypothetical protein